MKPKIGFLALFAVLLLVPSLAFGASTLYTVGAGVDAANKIGAGEDGVIGSFTVTDGATAGGSKIVQFDLNAMVATVAGNTMERADIAEVSVWVDVNQNGALERDVDIFVGKHTNTITTPLTNGDFGSDALAKVSIVLAGDAQVSLADLETKSFIVAITMREVPKGVAGEGAVIDVEVVISDNLAATPGVVGSAGVDQINAGGAAWANDTLDFKATHLTFKTTGYKDLSGGVGVNMLQAAGVLLNAVDDWGNVDTGFTEKVQFLLYNYSTLDPLTADFTATANNTSDNVTWGSSWTTSPAMVAGVLSTNTGGVLGTVRNINYNPASATESSVVLVARSQVNEIEARSPLPIMPLSRH